MYYLILKIMEQNYFIRSIREVMEKTTLALQNGFKPPHCHLLYTG